MLGSAPSSRSVLATSTIRGVNSSTYLMLGSAPSSRSVLATSTFPVLAASIRGVVPSCTQNNLTHPFVHQATRTSAATIQICFYRKAFNGIMASIPAPETIYLILYMQYMTCTLN